MSKEILEMTALQGYLSIIIILGLIIWFLFIIVSAFVKLHYGKKKNEYGDLKGKLLEKYKNKVSGMPPYLDGEVEGQAEMRQKITEEKDDELEIFNEKIEKYEKRYSLVDRIVYNVTIATIIFAVMLAGFNILLKHSTGGYVSDIMIVNDVTTEGVSVPACYHINYNNIEQDTIAIIVRNDSGKKVNKAKITEKSTDTVEYIELLDAGQEKILTFDIYPKKDNKYTFDISDIEFQE